MTDALRTPDREGFGEWEWNIVADRVTWSDDLYRLYGLEPREFRASYEAFVQRIHPDDRRRVELILRQALRDGKAVDFEHRLMRPDGSIRMLSCHADVEQGPDGQPRRMWGTARDISR